MIGYGTKIMYNESVKMHCHRYKFKVNSYYILKDMFIIETVKTNNIDENLKFIRSRKM